MSVVAATGQAVMEHAFLISHLTNVAKLLVHHSAGTAVTGDRFFPGFTFIPGFPQLPPLARDMPSFSRE